MTDEAQLESQLVLDTAIELTEWFKQQGVPTDRALRAMEMVKRGLAFVETMKAKADG